MGYSGILVRHEIGRAFGAGFRPLPASGLVRGALAALLGLFLLGADAQLERFPARLIDIDGSPIDVSALASERRLIVVTLKAPWCPVCARQLARLEGLSAALENCGATFLVLSPGPADRIRAVREATGFQARYVEDRDLAIARSLGLELAPDQIVPSLLAIDSERAIIWQQRGRSGVSYGDGRLQRYLGCETART